MGEITSKDCTGLAQATLTFWIPERIDSLMSEHERRKGVSRSAFMRAILRRYLYGLYGTALSSTHAGVPTRTPASKRGTWGGRITELGKNTVEVKLSLPRAWRDDLVALAADAGITLSHFARELVVSHLLGHAYLPARVMGLHTKGAEQD